jgi:hypothetical protein
MRKSVARRYTDITPRESQYKFKLKMNEVSDEQGHYFTVSMAGKDLRTGKYMFISTVGNSYGYRDRKVAEKLFENVARQLKSGVNYELLTFKGSPTKPIVEE